MAQTVNSVNEVSFGPDTDFVDVGLICTCGRPVSKFIGFRIFSDKRKVSSVICSCEVGQSTL